MNWISVGDTHSVPLPNFIPPIVYSSFIDVLRSDAKGKFVVATK
jgi:hypothetical protein